MLLLCSVFLNPTALEGRLPNLGNIIVSVSTSSKFFTEVQQIKVYLNKIMNTPVMVKFNTIWSVFDELLS